MRNLQHVKTIGVCIKFLHLRSHKHAHSYKLLDPFSFPREYILKHSVQSHLPLSLFPRYLKDHQRNYNIHPLCTHVCINDSLKEREDREAWKSQREEREGKKEGKGGEQTWAHKSCFHTNEYITIRRASATLENKLGSLLSLFPLFFISSRFFKTNFISLKYISKQ